MFEIFLFFREVFIVWLNELVIVGLFCCWLVFVFLMNFLLESLIEFVNGFLRVFEIFFVVCIVYWICFRILLYDCLVFIKDWLFVVVNMGEMFGWNILVLDLMLLIFGLSEKLLVFLIFDFL